MSETIKLLGSTKSKIKKDGNSENLPHLEITDIVLVHCSIANNYYQQDAKVLYTFVPNQSFGHYSIFHPKKKCIFKNFWLSIFIC